MSPRLLLPLCLFPLFLASAKDTQKEKSVEELTASSRASVVAISHEGRAKGEGGLGAGFIISKDGLIATNWHVINEGRRIDVELHDGTKLPVTEVFASDRKMDLALIKIEPEKDLQPLKLGDSDTLTQGQAVVALGNPRGFKYSVVEGVVSGFREIGEGPFPLIQIAMPVEQGNSGGPLIDRQGRVQGIISLKSLVTENLGFATPVNALDLLREKPNPIPMDRWATIGALNKRQWETIMGANWSQRAGRIQVKGTGDGFGGRSLCLSQRDVPQSTYELEVEVKLDDESGAAGLAFASDGSDTHYGFYPSGGQLRLTRFEGPNVFNWTILEQLEVPEYRMGDWNRLKVRVEPKKITCWVNGTEVLTSGDTVLRDGKVGLCKFRQTVAEFRGFRIAKKIEEESIDTEVLAGFNDRIEAYLRSEEQDRDKLLASLTQHPEEARDSLKEMSEAMHARLEELERLTRDANAELIARQLVGIFDKEKEDEIDLFHAGLLVSKLDNPDLDVEAYLQILDDMGKDIRQTLEKETPEKKRIEAVKRFMFEENGFHGSRLDYYHESNSYLNEVIDDREGIPITLAVVFMELAHRAGATSVHGIGLPGHFVAGYEPEKGKKILLDVFDGAKTMTDAQASRIVFGNEAPVPANLLEPVSKRQILTRILRNLIELKKGQGDATRALPYIHLTLALDPENAAARFDRAIMRFQEGDRAGAKTDLRWLIQNEPPGLNMRRLRDFYERL